MFLVHLLLPESLLSIVSRGHSSLVSLPVTLTMTGGEGIKGVSGISVGAVKRKIRGMSPRVTD
jgi:hypothetical protein